MKPHLESPSASPLAEALAAEGYAVVEGFLPEDVCAALAGEIRAAEADGKFRPAGIGRGAHFKVNPEVRSDQVLWLSEASLTDTQRIVWTRLEALRLELNRRLFLGLRWFEGHLAVYPAGARYAKHLDRFQLDRSPVAAARALSFVLYLNPTWTAADGGALRLYRRDAHDQALRDVLPQGGTLVCFLSAEIPHEVLPPRKPRLSCTGWFRTDSPA